MRSTLTSGTKVAVMLLVTLLVLSCSVLAQRTRIVHLHDSSHQAEWTAWLREAKARFEEQNPDIEIELMIQGRAGGIEKLILLYGTGEHPDVTEVFPSEHYRFAIDGMFQDLNPLMEQETMLGWDQFFPVGVEAATIIEEHPGAGRRWMLPVSLWVIGQAFNDSHFEEAGLVPPSRLGYHWTWDEFAEFSQKLTKVDGEGNTQRHGVGLGGYVTWIHSAGGSLFDRYVDPSSATVQTDQVYHALGFIQDALHRSSYAMRSPFIQHFTSEQISIYPGGPNTTTFLRSAGVNWKWSYGPNPIHTQAGSETLTLGLALSSQSQHPEAAWRWMKFLATEFADEHVAYTGRPAAWGPVAQDYQTHFANATEWEHVWIELISRADSHPRIVASSEVLATWDTYLREVLSGEVAVEAAMERAQGHLGAILPVNRLGR